ncbi:LysR family transcriptional regulator [Microbacterium sp. 18062]|uniref:LysR family transcriptional regulator n=1 Tax=Microbacterium sp. 18062 TaxID=2681410 RepID=UPI001356C94A|nr:LysR family transcriptional regulator [Microbacterium sp. 18062]
MQLTQLEYFVAVAREQHFGRAAAACYVSPSALSEAIRKLEAELGVPLVRRGRVFEGLTPEGELALVWSRRVLADDRALRDELDAARDRLRAEVRFGVIPSALPRAATLLTALATRHPLTRVRMLTGLTSEEIARRLRRYELDAGLIHPSIEDTEGLVVTPLYEESMVVVGAPEIIPADRSDLPGRELSALPLCLLEPHMRARQLLDAVLRQQGITLAPRIESDSIEGLLALARTGRWAAVVPRSALSAEGAAPRMRALRLVEPAVILPIALAQLSDEPRPPIALALAAALDLEP